MTTSYGEAILSVFEVWEESRAFLADLIESRIADDDEIQALLDKSLLAGAEDWHFMIHCASSMQFVHGHDPCSHDGTDVAAYLWNIFLAVDRNGPAKSAPWEETDRLIARAKALESEAAFFRPYPSASGCLEVNPAPGSSKPRSAGTVSHYWSDRYEDHSDPETAVRCLLSSQACHLPPRDASYSELSNRQLPQAPNHTSERSYHGSLGPVPAVRLKNLVVSPYFSTATSTKKTDTSTRPPPGTVSSLQFPPLTASHFGLLQEQVAHEPFWLLIAVTFLIKTKGKHAIPIFHQVRKRFPTPHQLADPGNAEELSNMIHHLGLSVIRVKYLQKYAKAFVENPPRVGVRYKVRNYDRRDISLLPDTVDGSSDVVNTDSLATFSQCDGDAEAWEIGHMTQGKYTIDSWRIFCRDEFLGRASDWNGKGREAEFQPEWMRVMPLDKELRAYLRWMWMREGWEWDPMTGERKVLREATRRAADEGRVVYDDTGGLRIVGTSSDVEKPANEG
ncbi:hypothetical protein RJ55_05158 [Drechmeria coniospora]|nr:hypothetical protein RJ55_05158 [Drechmeria coniospora]